MCLRRRAWAPTSVTSEVVVGVEGMAEASAGSKELARTNNRVVSKTRSGRVAIFKGRGLLPLDPPQIKRRGLSVSLMRQKLPGCRRLFSASCGDGKSQKRRPGVRQCCSRPMEGPSHNSLPNPFRPPGGWSHRTEKREACAGGAVGEGESVTVDCHRDCGGDWQQLNAERREKKPCTY